MELLFKGMDILLHLDKYLDLMIQTMGLWSYAILFLIIFCETGLVITPVLRAIPCCLPWEHLLLWGRLI